VQLLRDCHQIVTKSVEFFARRLLAVEIRVRIAHRDADSRVSQQFFHRHYVDAAVHKTRSESVPQRMPRHSVDFRVATSKRESCFQIGRSVGKLFSSISLHISRASLRSVSCFFTRLAWISAGSPIHSWKPDSARLPASVASTHSDRRVYRACNGEHDLAITLLHE